MERFRGLEQAPTQIIEDEKNLASGFEESSDTGGNGKKSEVPVLEYPQRSSEEYKIADENKKMESVLEFYSSIIKDSPLLTAIQEKEYVQMFQQGNLAEKELAQKILIESNLGWVIKVARSYVRPDAPLEDLIQEGIMGLVYAAGKFDEERGCRFLTFATDLIRNRILDYLTNRADIVRKPEHIVGKIGQFKKADEKLGRELGRDPNDQELADYLGVEKEKVQGLKLWSALVDFSYTIPVEEGGQSLPKIALIEDQNSGKEEKVLIMRKSLEEIYAVAGLTKRERELLVSYYNAKDRKNSNTYEEIGRQHGLRKGGVTQTIVRARRKIRICLAKHPEWADAINELGNE